MAKQVSIQHAVNWYFGNYCTRKCYKDINLQRKHYLKLETLASKLKDTKMTRKNFFEMLRADKTICNLSEQEWKERKFSWKNKDCNICKRWGLS